MFTMHVYKQSNLLIIGGRGIESGKPISPDSISFQNSIFSIDTSTLHVSKLTDLPTSIASHSSVLINDRYIVIYGGTQGLRFFDNLLRYDIDT
jgi:hypothetical protein